MRSFIVLSVSLLARVLKERADSLLVPAADGCPQTRSIVLAVVTTRSEQQEKYLGRYALRLLGAGTSQTLNGKIKSCEGVQA
jgi:hypothetical protein